MSPFELGLIFIGLILILSAMRSRLVYELASLSLLTFGEARYGVWIYSIFVLPGTIIHELSHWLMAEILRVRTGEIVIFPDLSDGSETKRLGSVATEKTDPLRGFLIGVAPFFVGIFALVILGKVLQDNWGISLWWQTGLLIYGIMVVGNSMMISKEDRRTWPAIIILILIIFLLLKVMGIQVILSDYSWLNLSLSRLNIVLGVTAGLNLVMILVAYGLRSLIETVTKRHIVQK